MCVYVRLVSTGYMNDEIHKSTGDIVLHVNWRRRRLTNAYFTVRVSFRLDVAS